jgi:hypothetical protein
MRASGLSIFLLALFTPVVIRGQMQFESITICGHIVTTIRYVKSSICVISSAI